MSKLSFPVGLVALLLVALGLSAQVRDNPRGDAPPPPRPPREKAVSPDRDLPPGPKGLAEKQGSRGTKRSRVYLGVYTVPVEDMSNRDRKKLKLTNTDGVIIVEVMPDSPAEEAGLHHNDVITHVNGKLVDDEEELSKDLHQLGVGKPVKLSIIRDGKKQEITAELGEAPAGHAGQQGGEGFHEEIMSLLHENAQMMERLERKIDRLEKRLKDMDRAHSQKNP